MEASSQEKQIAVNEDVNANPVQLRHPRSPEGICAVRSTTEIASTVGLFRRFSNDLLRNPSRRVVVFSANTPKAP
jgi:hypothetical protein